MSGPCLVRHLRLSCLRARNSVFRRVRCSTAELLAKSTMEFNGFTLVDFKRDASTSFDNRVYYLGAGALYGSDGSRSLVFHAATLYMTGTIVWALLHSTYCCHRTGTWLRPLSLLLSPSAPAVAVTYGNPVGSSVSYNAYGWGQIDAAKSKGAWVDELDPRGCGRVVITVSGMKPGKTNDAAQTGLFDAESITISQDPNCAEKSGARGCSCDCLRDSSLPFQCSPTSCGLFEPGLEDADAIEGQKSCIASDTDCKFSGYWLSKELGCVTPYAAAAGVYCSRSNPSGPDNICNAVIAQCSDSGKCDAPVFAEDGFVCGTNQGDPCLLDRYCKTGQCVNHPAPDGTVCRVGDAANCLGPAKCSKGECPQANPVFDDGDVCVAAVDVRAVGPLAGLRFPVMRPCAASRLQACHTDQVCQDGACQGSELRPNGTVCARPASVCLWASQCFLGECSYVPKSDGTLCGPAPNDCQWRPKCSKGVCVPQIKPDGTPCDDGSPITLKDACSAGVCAGTLVCTSAHCHAPPACRARLVLMLALCCLPAACAANEFINADTQSCAKCSICTANEVIAAECSTFTDRVCMRK